MSLEQDSCKHMTMEMKAMLYRAALALNAAATQMKITHATTPTAHLVLGVKNALKKVADDSHNLLNVPCTIKGYKQMAMVADHVGVLHQVVTEGFNLLPLLRRPIKEIEGIKKAVAEAYDLLMEVRLTMSEMVFDRLR